LRQAVAEFEQGSGENQPSANRFQIGARVRSRSNRAAPVPPHAPPAYHRDRIFDRQRAPDVGQCRVGGLQLFVALASPRLPFAQIKRQPQVVPGLNVVGSISTARGTPASPRADVRCPVGIARLLRAYTSPGASRTFCRYARNRIGKPPNSPARAPEQTRPVDFSASAVPRFAPTPAGPASRRVVPALRLPHPLGLRAGSNAARSPSRQRSGAAATGPAKARPKQQRE